MFQTIEFFGILENYKLEFSRINLFQYSEIFFVGLWLK